MIAVLSGGVGAARMLRALSAVMDPSGLVAIVNTGDDLILHGLDISPDLDTITYTLAGAINTETGWGLTGETWATLGALERYGHVRPLGSQAATTWFGLGDQDLATHLYRTHRRGEGATLTEVTAEIARAWSLGPTLLPVTDDPLRTMVTVADGEISFQEYFVGRHHDVAVTSVRFAGSESCAPTPAVLAALRDATRVVIAPSNPVVSIGPLLAVPGVREALVRRRSDVIAVSPIVAGAALKGPADRMLRELGHEPSVVGVARIYREFASVLVIDHADAEHVGAIAEAGMAAVVTDTVMRTPEIAAELARVVLRGGSA